MSNLSIPRADAPLEVQVEYWRGRCMLAEREVKALERKVRDNDDWSGAQGNIPQGREIPWEGMGT